MTDGQGGGTASAAVAELEARIQGQGAGFDVEGQAAFDAWRVKEGLERVHWPTPLDAPALCQIAAILDRSTQVSALELSFAQNALVADVLARLAGVASSLPGPGGPYDFQAVEVQRLVVTDMQPTDIAAVCESDGTVSLRWLAIERRAHNADSTIGTLLARLLLHVRKDTYHEAFEKGRSHERATVARSTRNVNSFLGDDRNVAVI